MVAPIVLGSLILGGAQLYSGWQAAKGAKKQAAAARQQAEETKTASINKIAQLKSEQSDRADQHAADIAAIKERTAAQSAAATAAQQSAIKQINQQRAQSSLAIQQKNLQTAMQRQQGGQNVSTKTRKRVGSPLKLRTGVQANSALAFGGSTKSSKGSSKLNV